MNAVEAQTLQPVQIIAEAGVNHNGDLAQAIALVRAAKRVGADVVKFQHFTAQAIVASDAAAAAYQIENTGTGKQADLLRGLELGLRGFAEIAKVCREEGIVFLCTAFDLEKAGELVALGMQQIKIPSGEITNRPMLRHYARFGLPVLLSTGMSDLEEVGTAVDILSEAGADEVTLLQCTSLYPAAPETINLRAMTTMRDHFGRPVGFSDHSLGDHAAIAAVAMGACVIEKHFTLDCSLPGPDHRASLEPVPFAEMVRRIRDVEAMLGDGQKRPAADEDATARLVRRSWHAARDIPAGHILLSGDVVLKRPASGILPDVEIVGRRTKRAVKGDAAIVPEDIDA